MGFATVLLVISLAYERFGAALEPAPLQHHAPLASYTLNAYVRSHPVNPPFPTPARMPSAHPVQVARLDLWTGHRTGAAASWSRRSFAASRAASGKLAPSPAYMMDRLALTTISPGR